MREEDIKQELVKQGKNPNDFNIVMQGSAVMVTPKWFAEHKWIAQKEDAILGVELSQREIENIELGQLVSELEIQLLMLGGA